MRYLLLISSAFGMVVFGNTPKKTTVSTRSTSETIRSYRNKDKNEIQSLIRQMLKWADSENAIDLHPTLNKDSVCVGLDLDKLNQNLDKLRKTGFFAEAFIDNYNQIIKTVDKRIENDELKKWNVYDAPPFNFTNDVNPWCSSDDNLSWDKVEVRIVKIDKNKAELKWTWGKLESKSDQSLRDFSYKFEVVKVNNKWKISYLQGFDYK